MQSLSKFERGLGRFVSHTAAIVVGFVLMAIGLGMGVTVFMLPVGVPVGLLGLGMFLWGMFERARKRDEPGPK